MTIWLGISIYIAASALLALAALIHSARIDEWSNR
jgi:hypothetical protein